MCILMPIAVQNQNFSMRLSPEQQLLFKGFKRSYFMPKNTAHSEGIGAQKYSILPG